MITAIIGSQGSGKSLWLAKILLSEIKDGKRVVTNMKLNINAPYEYVRSLEDFKNAHYQDCVIGIDEANLWGLDCRTSNKNIHMTTEIIQQVRKMGNFLFYTVQEFSKVDKRLRDATDIYMKCKKYVIIDGKKCQVVGSSRLGRDKLIIIETVMIYLDNEDVPPKRFSIVANDYYDVYDTRQMQTSQYEVKPKLAKSQESFEMKPFKKTKGVEVIE